MSEQVVGGEAAVSWPGQCCATGYCIEAIGVHGETSGHAEFVAERVAALIDAAVDEALQPVRALGEKWESERMSMCRSCREPARAQYAPHNCAVSRKWALDALRAVLPAEETP